MPYKNTTKDYSNSKIYLIKPMVDHEESDQYVGSTTLKYLSQRFSRHRNSYNTWLDGYKRQYCSAFDIFNKYGINNCAILLLENCESIKDVNELRVRERFHIENLKHYCVNKVLPSRTNKEYRETHKEKLFIKSCIYRQEHKEQIKKQRQLYQNLNKEQIKKQRQCYHEINKEQINIRKKPTFTCSCGSILRYSDKARHFRSQKHINFIEENKTTQIINKIPMKTMKICNTIPSSKIQLLYHS